jgi:type II secretory pathway predicted ATPase ExeA
VFVGGTVEEALARCDFSADQQNQFGLVIGPSGVGKTTLFEHFATKRNASSPKDCVLRVDLANNSLNTISLRLANDLGLGPNREQDTWGLVRDQLFAQYSVGHRTLLLLDNVHEMNEQQSETLATLLSPESLWSSLLSVDDESIVNLPRWLLDQCELKIELPAWDLGQTADYFEFAIPLCGGSEDAFDAQSITRVQELSDGIPRKICQIAGLALVAGAVRRVPKVTAELVDEVCDEFTVSMGAKSPAFWTESQMNAT